MVLEINRQSTDWNLLWANTYRRERIHAHLHVCGYQLTEPHVCLWEEAKVLRLTAMFTPASHAKAHRTELENGKQSCLCPEYIVKEWTNTYWLATYPFHQPNIWHQLGLFKHVGQVHLLKFKLNIRMEKTCYLMSDFECGVVVRSQRVGSCTAICKVYRKWRGNEKIFSIFLMQEVREHWPDCFNPIESKQSLQPR